MHQTALPCPPRHCGRAVALPQDVLTMASHTTDGNTRPTHLPNHQQRQLTMARSSSASWAVNTSTSGPNRPLTATRTGSKPCPAGTGSPRSASTDPPRNSSTAPGPQETSPKPEPPRWGQTSADRWGRSTVGREQAGTASGVLNTSRQLGGALAVAIFGALLARPGGFDSGVRISLLIAGAIALVTAAMTAGYPPSPGQRRVHRGGTLVTPNRATSAGWLKWAPAVRRPTCRRARSRPRKGCVGRRAGCRRPCKRSDHAGCNPIRRSSRWHWALAPSSLPPADFPEAMVIDDRDPPPGRYWL